MGYLRPIKVDDLQNDQIIMSFLRNEENYRSFATISYLTDFMKNFLGKIKDEKRKLWYKTELETIEFIDSEYERQVYPLILELVTLLTND